MLSYFFIDKVITSWNWKWFNNADVITNIIVLKKRKVILDINENEQISFITINHNLNNLEKEDINKVSKQILINRQVWNDILINKYSLKDISFYQKLNIWWNALFSDVNFLFDVYDKVVDINNYFEVQRGEKTWCDDLFYPDENNWIEPEFIQKTLKTTKWNKFYTIEPEDNTFTCSSSFDDLIKLNKIWAIKWIKKFEHKKNSVTTKKWKKWYDFPCNIKVDFLINVNPDKSITFYWLDNSSYIWQRWIWLKIKNWNDKELLHSLLNSILSVFFIEAVWFWRWLWALDLNSTKIQKMKILDIEKLTEIQKKEIIKKFNKLKMREIKSIDIEFDLDDRIEFDKYVLECFWIINIYDSIKSALIKLFKIRSSVN